VQSTTQRNAEQYDADSDRLEETGHTVEMEENSLAGANLTILTQRGDAERRTPVH
jgi:hypothetical protein